MTAKVMTMVKTILLVLLSCTSCFGDGTTDNVVSITKSNRRKDYEPGELIFSDEFDKWDCEKWSHEITLGGNENWEFQLYENSRKVSYVRNGYLHIKPRLTSEVHNLYEARVDMNAGAPMELCTNPSYYGCERQGKYPQILNPISSAQLRTLDSFYFQYGRVEVRAKLPGGDWMWPSLKLYPRFNKYGSWPASGSIDVFQSRGNQQLYSPTIHKKNIGSEMIASALHFGPDKIHDAVDILRVETSSPSGRGFDQDFHVYGLEWTDDHISFFIDNITTRTVTPGEDGFWDVGQFDNSVMNPWKHSDYKRMAPFDQKFFLVLNVAVGGVNGYFDDDAVNTKGKKPWKNRSPTSTLEFWNGRDTWYPTWAGDNGTLLIDYIRIYAV